MLILQSLGLCALHSGHFESSDPEHLKHVLWPHGIVTGAINESRHTEQIKDGEVSEVINNISAFIFNILNKYMIIKFLLMLAIVTGLVYLTVAPEDKPGVVLLAMVITLLVIGFTPRSQTAGAPEATDEKIKTEVKLDVTRELPVEKPRESEPVKASTKSAASKHVLIEPNLQQVDVLGRNVDDKMALNKTASKVIVPGGVNDVFEARVKTDKQDQIAGYEGNDFGALF